MATAFLPDGTTFEIVAKMAGTVRWTAEGRKVLEEESDILKGMAAEERVARRLGVSVRVVQERARAKGVGRKLGRTWHFMEAEILELMESNSCSGSTSGKTRPTSTRAGGTSGSALSKVLELVSAKRPKDSSPKSKKKSSTEKVVALTPRHLPKRP
jgi:hypothetical protein